ncbi:hypothetical protein D3C81_1085530 [compost metagenome]
MHTCTALRHALLADIVKQRAPQLGLPAITGRQRFTLATGGIEDVFATSPILEPVGSVNLVLVEKVGQALGKLVTLAQVAIVGEKAAQGLEMRALDQRREQAHQAPGQRRLVEQGNLRDLIAAQYSTVKLPHEAAG